MPKIVPSKPPLPATTLKTVSLLPYVTPKDSAINAAAPNVTIANDEFSPSQLNRVPPPPPPSQLPNVPATTLKTVSLLPYVTPKDSAVNAAAPNVTIANDEFSPSQLPNVQPSQLNRVPPPPPPSQLPNVPPPSQLPNVPVQNKTTIGNEGEFKSEEGENEEETESEKFMKKMVVAKLKKQEKSTIPRISPKRISEEIFRLTIDRKDFKSLCKEAQDKFKNLKLPDTPLALKKRDDVFKPYIDQIFNYILWNAHSKEMIIKGVTDVVRPAGTTIEQTKVIQIKVEDKLKKSGFEIIDQATRTIRERVRDIKIKARKDYDATKKKDDEEKKDDEDFKGVAFDTLQNEVQPIINNTIKAISQQSISFKAEFEKELYESNQRVENLFKDKVVAKEIKDVYALIDFQIGASGNPDDFFNVIQSRVVDLDIHDDTMFKEYLALVGCLYVKLTNKMLNVDLNIPRPEPGRVPVLTYGDEKSIIYLNKGIPDNIPYENVHQLLVNILDTLKPSPVVVFNQYGNLNLG